MSKNEDNKKLYLAKADKIVSDLAVETVDENTLISYIDCIEAYHYEEIVEERFLSKLCGYSICSNILTNIPKQKYQIVAKQNKVLELSDRKRYCSPECFKASKILEGQISTTPVWLRHTPEYKKTLAENPIRLYKPKKTKPKKEEPIKEDQPSAIEPIPKIQDSVFSSDIENDLKRIEADWESKFKIKESRTPVDFIPKVVEKKPEVTNEIDEESERDFQKRSEILKKKFIESLDIHKKPADLDILKKIFEFRMKEEGSVEEQTNHEDYVFYIDQNSMKQLLFIEYITQRVNDLISRKTKNYLKEQSKSEINEQREREEYLKQCDKYVAHKEMFFNNLTKHAAPTQPNAIAMNNQDEDDNGEAEMLAKLKSFEHVTGELKDKQNKDDSDEEKDNSEAKKPLPSYDKLKEEAFNQQLRVREFFRGPSVWNEKPVKKEPEPSIRERATIIDLKTNKHYSDDRLDREDFEYGQSLIMKIKETNEEIVRVLPTVDSKSQMEIRRNIFYDNLVK